MLFLDVRDRILRECEFDRVSMCSGLYDEKDGCCCSFGSGFKLDCGV